jgi:hypothetical protein
MAVYGCIDGNAVITLQNVHTRAHALCSLNRVKDCPNKQVVDLRAIGILSGVKPAWPFHECEGRRTSSSLSTSLHLFLHFRKPDLWFSPIVSRLWMQPIVTIPIKLRRNTARPTMIAPL